MASNKKPDRAEFEERREPITETLPPGFASQYDRDRARVIHSFAFRRLQAKTQVLGIGEGDFYRTRLTHSMEVAQIARGIVRRILKVDPKPRPLLSEDLIEAVCFAHDLGHPPFGHAGERALHNLMKDHGGFEGNAQTLRILSTLESHTQNHGLNLTRRTLLGVLKYPAVYHDVRQRKNEDERSGEEKQDKEMPTVKPAKCYYEDEQQLVDWILKPATAEEREMFQELAKAPTTEKRGETHRKSLDCSIMDLADDISYGVHDLEDAVTLGLLEREALEHATKEVANWLRELELAHLWDDLYSGNSCKRKSVISTLVRTFVGLADYQSDASNGFCSILFDRVQLPDEANKLLKNLKDVVYDEVMQSRNVCTLEHRGSYVIKSLFKAYESDPEHLLPTSVWRAMESKLPDHQKRVICDYVAGFTDEYATRMYERLYVPRHGTVFERI